MEDFVNNIDFRLLATQKATLEKLSESSLLSVKEKRDLEGIAGLISELQDQIVDSELKTEEEVFPYLDQEEN